MFTAGGTLYVMDERGDMRTITPDFAPLKLVARDQYLIAVGKNDIAAWDLDQLHKLWEVKTEKVRSVIGTSTSIGMANTLNNDSIQINAVFASESNRLWITTGEANYTIVAYNLATGQRERTISLPYKKSWLYQNHFVLNDGNRVGILPIASLMEEVGQ